MTEAIEIAESALALEKETLFLDLNWPYTIVIDLGDALQLLESSKF